MLSSGPSCWSLAGYTLKAHPPSNHFFI